MRSSSYGFRIPAGATPAPVAFQKPDLCPFCRSTQIATTSKTIGEDTYWRCTPCGQIWNQGRLQAGTRHRR